MQFSLPPVFNTPTIRGAIHGKKCGLKNYNEVPITTDGQKTLSVFTIVSSFDTKTGRQTNRETDGRTDA